MKTTDYLELLKEKLGWSDYRIAKEIGITRASVSAYRNQGTEFSDESAIKVAKLLDISELKILADMHAARAKDPTVKKSWQKIASTAAGIILFLNVGVNDAQAIEKPTLSKINSVNSLYYVKLNTYPITI